MCGLAALAGCSLVSKIRDRIGSCKGGGDVSDWIVTLVGGWRDRSTPQRDPVSRINNNTSLILLLGFSILLTTLLMPVGLRSAESPASKSHKSNS